MAFLGAFIITWSVPAFDAVEQPAIEFMLRQPSPPEQKSHQIGKSITVKIFYSTAEGWGSGTLVKSEGEVYTVVTNRHVLNGGTSYQVQTPDDRIYPAQVIAIPSFADRDLAVVTFRSSQTYQVATPASASTVKVGDRVYAVGFPAQNPTVRGFYVTDGQISLVTDQAFVGGYQIGYTNPVEKGMSGGPLLNDQGEVIGINGMHAYPLWGNPYVFLDGTTPPVAMQKQMRLLSWAIPIQNFWTLTSPSASGDTSKPISISQFERPINPATHPNALNFFGNDPVYVRR
jgi:serine protease Do